MRKIIVFIYGIVLMSLVVFAVSYNIDHDTNKAVDKYLRDNCDGYANTEECLEETNEDRLEEIVHSEKIKELKRLTDKAIRQCEANPWMCQYPERHLNFAIKEAEGYYCEEGIDQTDYYLCINISTDGHECYQNINNEWNITCHENVWLPIESEQGNNS